MTVQCQYALMAVDSEGKWRKETPTPDGRPLAITFTNPSDKELVAADINEALEKEAELVYSVPYPYPAEYDTTTLQFYKTYGQTNPPQYSKVGPPVQLEPLWNRIRDMPSLLAYLETYAFMHNGQNMTLTQNGKGCIVLNSLDLMFIIRGQNQTNAERMVKLFGGSGDYLETDSPTWTSPRPSYSDKETPHLEPYNLVTPDFRWWYSNIEYGERKTYQYITEGHEYINIQESHSSTSDGSSWGMMSSSRPVAYRDLLKCESLLDLATLVLGDKVNAVMKDGRLNLTLKSADNATGTPAPEDLVILYTGMPCDFVPKALGVGKYWKANNGCVRTEFVIAISSDGPTVLDQYPAMRFHLKKQVADLVHFSPIPDRPAIEGKMSEESQVQGFSIIFPKVSPFYPYAALSVGHAPDASKRPPPGHLIHTVPLDHPIHHPRQDDTRINHDPYPLSGMLPYSESGTLVLKREWWKKKPPDSGYHLRVYAKRPLPRESWSGVHSKEAAYALTDIVGDLPHPASYKTSDDIIDALYLSVDKAIANDPYNSQQGFGARDLLKVTYDKSTRKYSFECGKDAAMVTFTMHRTMAALLGAVEDHDMRDLIPITLARRPTYTTATPTQDDIVWAREGQYVVQEPWKKHRMITDDEVWDATFTAHYPVTPSRGIQVMHVKCNLVDPVTVTDRHRENCIAIVPVDWSKDKSLHEPYSRFVLPVNCNRITSVHIQIHDMYGKSIKFMGYDDNGVTCMLRLSRSKDA